jgi:hypothetical protein
MRNNENVPGSAAILAAVDEIMQARMPALPGIFSEQSITES